MKFTHISCPGNCFWFYSKIGAVQMNEERTKFIALFRVKGKSKLTAHCEKSIIKDYTNTGNPNGCYFKINVPSKNN